MTYTDLADEIIQDCLSLQTRALSRLVTAIFSSALENSGITPHQLAILAVIARHPGLPPCSLGELLHMEKSTVSRNVRRLLDRNLIIQNPRRLRNALAISASGRRILRKVHPEWHRAQQQALETLGELEAKNLANLAKKLLPLYQTTPRVVRVPKKRRPTILLKPASTGN